MKQNSNGIISNPLDRPIPYNLGGANSTLVAAWNEANTTVQSPRVVVAIRNCITYRWPQPAQQRMTKSVSRNEGLFWSGYWIGGLKMPFSFYHSHRNWRFSFLIVSVLISIDAPLLLFGSSKSEPGASPGSDSYFEFFKWSEINSRGTVCGQSRLHGGMHFSKAVTSAEELWTGVASLIVKKAESLKAGSARVMITLPLPSRPGPKILRRWRSRHSTASKYSRGFHQEQI